MTGLTVNISHIKTPSEKNVETPLQRFADRLAILMLCALMLCPGDMFALRQAPEVQRPDTVVDVKMLVRTPVQVAVDTVAKPVEADEVSYLPDESEFVSEFGKEREFNPDPNRAVWLAALCPGLGQVYNRRYWKLPIIVGGFMGLGYATSWNNGQLRDYTTAYRDATDSDPATNSYMNFFPPTTTESDLDKTWLTNTLRSRKNFYRRNRDLCIICMAALYLLCMADAYIDASMTHFDISPDLSFDIQPAMFISPVDKKPSLGLNWAFNF